MSRRLLNEPPKPAPTLQLRRFLVKRSHCIDETWFELMALDAADAARQYAARLIGFGVEPRSLRIAVTPFPAAQVFDAMVVVEPYPGDSFAPGGGS